MSSLPDKLRISAHQGETEGIRAAASPRKFGCNLATDS